MTKYKVQATLYSYVDVYVEAEDEDEAEVLAQNILIDGGGEEVDGDMDIGEIFEISDEEYNKHT